MHHYATMVGSSRYYMVFVECEPFRAQLVPFVVAPEVAQRWKQSAARYWEQMAREDAGEAQPAMSPFHANKYGDCEYLSACFEHAWEPERMGQDYVRVERKEG